jgi:hypothetical protein
LCSFWVRNPSSCEGGRGLLALASHIPAVFVFVFVLGAFSSFSPATQWLALEWMVVTYDLLASTSKVREPTTPHPLEHAPQFAKQQLVVSPRMQPHIRCTACTECSFTGSNTKRCDRCCATCSIE